MEVKLELDNCAILVKNVGESKQLQKILINYGYTWSSGENYHRIPLVVAPQYILTKNGGLTWSSSYMYGKIRPTVVELSAVLFNASIKSSSLDSCI
jgi:hypothetical protein